MKSDIHPITGVLFASLKLAPISMIYYFSCMIGAGEESSFTTVIFAFFIGTIFTFIVSFLASICLFLPFHEFIKRKKVPISTQATFEKMMPILILIIGLFLGYWLQTPYKLDKRAIALAATIYLSAVTGWYLFCREMYGAYSQQIKEIT